MALLKKWRDKAYSETANKGDLQRLWADYFQKEKDIYAELLKNPDEEVKGTVKELAENENVTEELKAENQMLWVQKMNNIRDRATEIVNAELIFMV